MTILFNKSKYISLRKNLRKQMPRPEALLWYHIRRKQLKGYKFRRQFGIQNYVIDFYCPELKLGIEIDGDSHFTSTDALDYDKARTEYITSKGIRIICFTNLDITQNIDGVLTAIADHPPPNPSLVRRGRIVIINL